MSAFRIADENVDSEGKRLFKAGIAYLTIAVFAIVTIRLWYLFLYGYGVMRFFAMLAIFFEE